MKDEPVNEKETLINNLFTQEMGFSLVVDMLIKAAKPIIGHNMIYDIIYLYNQFIGVLPEEYSDFIVKVSINSILLYIVESLFPTCL